MYHVICISSASKEKEKMNDSIKSNWNRRIKNIAILAIAVCGLFSVFYSLYSLFPNTYKGDNYALRAYEQVKVEVDSGDTAWELQKELTPNERDIRYPLYLAKRLNPGIDLGNLHSGDQIIMLREKSKSSVLKEAKN